jgi:hypothetical protein
MRLSVTLIALMALASCSNNSGTGSTGSNNNGGGSTLYGANYLPLVDNTTLTGHVIGTMTHLDTNGNITSTEEVDQDWNAAIGFIESHNGRSVRPIYGFDKNGNKVNYGRPVGYGGSLDSEVFAMNHITTDAATILPKTISVGQTWTPAASALPIQCHAKLVQHLSQFTAKDGTSYSDVLQVFVSYLDSSFAIRQFNWSQANKYAASTDLYFANGVGLVEADIHSYEYLNYDFYNGNWDMFEHKTGTGTVWRKN